MRTSELAAPGKALLTMAALCLPSAVASEPAVTFAAYGDIGNTTDSAEVAALTRSRSPELILLLGDLCYGSTPIAEQVNANYSAEKSAGKLRPALGNHEFNDSCGGGNVASAYRAYFTLPNNERYYDFTRGPVHFFALNSFSDPDGSTASSKQATWLRGKLAASTSPWQIVFFHHPPFSSGIEHGSALSMRWPFEEWGVDAVIAAHDHDYERIMRDENGDGSKIPYFVSGLGGRSRRAFGTPVEGSVIRYSDAFGALFVTATSTSLRFEFRNTGGTVIDRFTRARIDTKPARIERKRPKRFELKTPPGQVRQ